MGSTVAAAAVGAAQWQGWVIGLAVAVSGLTALLVALWSRLRTAELRYNELSRGVRGENLEQLLERQLHRVQTLEAEAEELRGALARLADRQRGGLQHLGLIRYDAFSSVGGRQSFALAVVDDHADGFVLNSLFGREGSSMYAKPIREGRSEIGRAEEEAGALRQALAGIGRPA